MCLSVFDDASTWHRGGISERLPLSGNEIDRCAQLLGWLEHQGEHYGKLVTAYRANGIVPPVSRPKP